MAKRKETLEIEKALLNMCHDKGIYGCEEITIGFPNQKRGNEIVDFMTMDSKGTIRCYEIKVTTQDLKSDAKKSWYGHYNYLVVSEELFKRINDWTEYLPHGVGLIRACKKELPELNCMFLPKKQEILDETKIMLKESMVRSLYYKMIKYMDSQSIEKVNKLKKDSRYWERQYRNEEKERLILHKKVTLLERLKRKNEGRYISIDDLIKEELCLKEKMKSESSAKNV